MAELSSGTSPNGPGGSALLSKHFACFSHGVDSGFIAAGKRDEVVAPASMNGAMNSATCAGVPYGM